MDDDLTRQDESWDVETETIEGASPTDEIELSSACARLVSLTGTQAGTVYEVRGEALIGRHPSATVRLVDSDISRKHAQIYLERNDQWVVKDLGSRNATLVNGIPLHGTRVLKYGDRIQLGAKTMFVFGRQDKLEEQVLQSQRMEAVGRLAGGIAHDFNNLMSAIIGSVEYVEVRRKRGRPVDEAELSSCLDDVSQAARRAADLTQGLLAFSGDRQGVAPGPVDVVGIAREVVALCRRTFPDNVQLKLGLDSAARVVGRETQLHQILLNLCLNARDAMPTGGVISIAVRRVALGQPPSSSVPFLVPGNYVQIEVEDTGLGMEAETLQRAFEPFFTTKGQGSGLGLSTVYGLVRSYGGHVQLDSAPSEGTCVRVYLPAFSADEPRAQPLAAAVQEVCTGTLELAPVVSTDLPLVLVVDDEANVLRATRRLLSTLGFQAVVAESGLDAVRLFVERIGEIKLILLDIMMPSIGGDAVFTAVRALAPHVPVLLMSGYDQEGSSRRMLQTGAAGFLKKPFDGQGLQASITAAFEHTFSGNERGPRPTRRSV